MACLYSRRRSSAAWLVLLCVVFLPIEPLLRAASATPHGAEVLNYRIEWRLIHAGNARLVWAPVRSDQTESWHANLHVESAGLVSALFKVEDNYSAVLNNSFCVESSLLTSQQGLRARETKITFDSTRRKAEYVEKDLKKSTVIRSSEVGIPACVYDVIGGLYRLRAIRLAPGQSSALAVSDGKKTAHVRVEAQQREQVTTPAGVFQTVRHEAFLFNDVIYSRSGRVLIWLTDDDRRLPVQIVVRLQFPIGAITLRLEKEEKT